LPIGYKRQLSGRGIVSTSVILAVFFTASYWRFHPSSGKRLFLSNNSRASSVSW